MLEDPNTETAVSYTVNAAIAGLLAFFFGPLGAFVAWWFLGGVGFIGSLVRTLAFVILYAFIFGLLFMLALLFSAAEPILAVSMFPLGLGLYVILDIVLIVAVVKAALHPNGPEARNE